MTVAVAAPLQTLRPRAETGAVALPTAGPRAVVARTPEAAREAAERVECDYAPLAAEIDLAAAGVVAFDWEKGDAIPNDDEAILDLMEPLAVGVAYGPEDPTRGAALACVAPSETSIEDAFLVCR